MVISTNFTLELKIRAFKVCSNKALISKIHHGKKMLPDHLLETAGLIIFSIFIAILQFKALDRLVVFLMMSISQLVLSTLFH